MKVAYLMDDTLLHHRTWSIIGSGGYLPYLLIAITLVGPILTVANAQTTVARPPDWDAKMAALHDAGTGLMPLFALGDVNEDGQVDELDLELVRSIVQSENKVQPSAAISCPAAGDLNQNGHIDQRDLVALTEWIRQKVITPALSYQAVLPWDFKRFVIAASPSAERGGAAQIRFLDASLNATNTTVTVEVGDAVVGSAPDGRGYDVIVLAAAKAGDQIAIKIALPDKRSYYYTLPVEAASSSLSSDDAQK
jgi:hypothetical protein